MNRCFLCLNLVFCLWLYGCSGSPSGAQVSSSPDPADVARAEKRAKEDRDAAIAIEIQTREAAAAPPSTPATASVNDDLIDIGGMGATNSMPGNGRDVLVSGSAHRLTFSGDVGLLQAQGSDQQISLENAKSVVISGDNIHVTYSGPEPSVSVSGTGSTCEPR